MATLPSLSAPENGVPTASAVGRDYYSISQAAALLSVSRVSIWRWIRAGQLPVARLGHRTTRIKREDIERLLVHGGPARSGPSRAPEAGAEAATNGGIGSSRAPRSDWTETGASEHVVQFYEADEFLLDALSDF